MGCVDGHYGCAISGCSTESNGNLCIQDALKTKAGDKLKPWAIKVGKTDGYGVDEGCVTTAPCDKATSASALVASAAAMATAIYTMVVVIWNLLMTLNL